MKYRRSKFWFKSKLPKLVNNGRMAAAHPPWPIYRFLARHLFSKTLSSDCRQTQAVGHSDSIL